MKAKTVNRVISTIFLTDDTMVNLLINTDCNRSCSYCFAKEKMNSYKRLGYPNEITIEDLDRVLDFIIRCDCNNIQLLGGEPTIHSKFEEILIHILKRNIHISLLSNALWSREKNHLFSKIAPTKLSFLLNLDHPSTYKPEDWKTIEENLSYLNGRQNVTLSFNIHQIEPKCEYIFDIISKYRFTKLRLSFSMPVVFGKFKNTHLPVENYKYLSHFVINFVKKAETFGARVTIDNTVPICMFTSSELGELLLMRVLNLERNFTCFPAIDIGPDLSIWRCFGTSGLFNRRLEEFRSLTEIYEYYESIFRPYQFNVFTMKECSECKYAKESLCQGGCIGFSIAKCIELGNLDQEILYKYTLDMKPQLSENTDIRMYEIPEETYMLSNKNKNIIEISPSMKQLLELFNGKRTIGEVIEIYNEKSYTEDETENLLYSFLTDVANKDVLLFIKTLLNKEVLIIPT